MEQFNKALSFILGLIVVAVFIIVASGKFSIKGLNLAKSASPTKTAPTMTPIPTKSPLVTVKTNTNKIVAPTKAAQQKKVDPNFHSYSGSTVPTSIPNTGVPIVIFPLLGSSLLTGIFMKKSGKKD